MPLIFFLVIEYKMEMIKKMTNITEIEKVLSECRQTISKVDKFLINKKQNKFENIKRIENYIQYVNSLENQIETALEKCQKYWKSVVEKEIKKENECIKHTEIELEKYYAKYGKSGCTIEEIQKRYADEVNAYWIKNKWK